ncbi:unnamed protein product, partial [Choristocarpus tenellus]
QVVSLRNKLHQSQEEVKKFHRVLVKEVGEGEKLESVLKGEGWKGRAQHIVMLKARVRQLEEQVR